MNVYTGIKLYLIPIIQNKIEQWNKMGCYLNSGHFLKVEAQPNGNDDTERKINFRAILNHLVYREDNNLDLLTYSYIPSFYHGLWNFIDINKVKPDSAV
uniref:Uncharacterized protein n=1 Tax=Arundo donax TaxID=35708 RepID=A0A0A9DNE8_ARUDO